MAKLATARDSRMYGPRPIGNRWEYINAGIYVFSTVLLIGGFAAQFSPGHLDDKSGLVVVLIGIALAAVVNVHDLIAHTAGIDYCVALVELDPQLALVEFAVPVVMVIGSVLMFAGILLLLIQVIEGLKL